VLSDDRLISELRFETEVCDIIGCYNLLSRGRLNPQES